MKTARIPLRSTPRAWAPALVGLLLAVSACSAAPQPIAATSEAPPSPPSPPASPIPSAPSPALVVAPSPAPPPPPASLELAVESDVLVGKWPEGVIVVGDAAWVAVSGERRVVKFDLASKKVTARVSVGRLPVDMASSPAGDVFTLTHTDQTIWKIDPASARASVLARLPEYSQDMVYADGALWVLLWDKGSSQGSSVARVDLASGRLDRSPELGKNAFALAVGHGRVWVAHGRAEISVVDQATLAAKDDLAVGDGHMLVAVGREAVFTDTRDGVARIDPATGKVTHEVKLGAPPVVLRAIGDHVLAVDGTGRAWHLDPANLTVAATMKAPAGMVEPHDVAVSGDRLLFTSFGYRAGEPEKADGRLLMVTPR